MKELAYSKNMSEAKQKYLYECVDCGRNYDSGKLIYLCPACSNKQPFNQPPRGVLKVIYDYKLWF